MSKIVKETFVLFAITLIAGLCLGFVYNYTSEARAKQDNKAREEAYEAVMPGLGSFDNIKLNKSEVNSYISDKVKTNEAKNKISTIKEFNCSVDEVVNAFDKKGQQLGYIVTVTDKEAYGGTLQMTVGILSDGTVKGISFLTLDETPGLGMKAQDDSFKNQFKDKNVDYFVYNKSQTTADNEINAISSATITTNADLSPFLLH